MSDVDKLSDTELLAIIKRLASAFQASVTLANQDAPVVFQVIGPIDLSTARLESDPYPLGFPMKSIVVEAVSDPAAYVNFKPNSRDSNIGAKVLSQNDVLDFDNGISRAFLHWPAQAGKTITLVCGIDAKYKAGKIVSVNSGGVSINEGSAVARSIVALTAATGAAIVASNTNRKVANIYNDTGGFVYLGDATSVTDSGATKGLPLAPGATLQWRNTAALNGYSAAGGNLIILEET